MLRIAAISSSVYRRCPLRSFRGWISPRCSSRFKVVGLIPTWWAAWAMRICSLLMPVYPDLFGSSATIPDHVPPAGLGWGAGTLQGARRLTQVMDGARDEQHPWAMPRPGLPQPPWAASFAQQVYRLPRGG